MSGPVRDLIATLLVGVGLVLFGAWALGAPVPGIDTVEAVAVSVLILGVAASMSAVVPGFMDVIHGSRLYLAATSALGLLALAGGVYAVVAGEWAALALLITATVVLWAVSTARHLGLLAGRPGLVR